MGYVVQVPVLSGAEPGTVNMPYWRQHALAVASPANREPLLLVGHSGAGALLPAIGQALGWPPAAYLFVDAGLPHGGQSRLEARRERDEPGAEAVYQQMLSGRPFPDWTVDDLAGILPDAAVRRQLVDELNPQPLAYWTEPMPALDFPDVPGGYLYFSAPYQPSLDEAKALGWPVIELPAGHFHMLVDPPAVARALLDLAARLGALPRPAAPPQ